MRTVEFARVCSAVGQPVTFDAAQVGSYAHRLRSYWTRLAPAPAVEAVLTTVERPAGRLAHHVLKPGRGLQPSQHNYKEPWYPCNKAGAPPAALPTLAAAPRSYAFQPGKAGAVYCPASKEWSEPYPDERWAMRAATQQHLACHQCSATLSRGVVWTRRPWSCCWQCVWSCEVAEVSCRQPWPPTRLRLP